jgi:hypothetical protein
LDLVAPDSNAVRHALTLGGDVVQSITFCELHAQLLAGEAILLAVIGTNFDVEEPLGKAGELRANLWVPVREPDSRRLRQRTLGHQIAEEDGLVFADPVPSGSFDRAVGRRDDDVSRCHTTCGAPNDEAVVIDHPKWMVMSHCDGAPGLEAYTKHRFLVVMRQSCYLLQITTLVNGADA